ncbi:aminopeptidase [Oribacterium sp. WCC10]|uniref:aminopeptidase n=1 Tax=Oribacterium sp. WCC10 TaxID=1855343 RepID=UPI0008F15B58|nr:aminopeptidase [Oribacterium sp. WCC10]SFG31619.1 Thermophilic metalloprotease (M29) [Oribacterium sp. WCC10]
MERYDDAIERIRQIPEEKAVPETFRDYFMTCADFIIKIDDFLRDTEDVDLSDVSTEDDRGKELLRKLRTWNTVFYGEMADGYEKSYLNPSFAEKKLSPFGGVLSVLYMEITGLIPSAYEKDLSDITAVLETFIQIYCMFVSDYSAHVEDSSLNELPDVQAIKDVLYSYAFDYSFDFLQRDLDGRYIAGDSYTRSVVLNHDFKTASDLYLLGTYVSEAAEKTAEFIASLPQEEVDRMAYTWYKGFKDGFRIQGKPYEKKSLIEFRYQVGFERVVKRTAEYFREDGFDFTIPRKSGHFITRSPKGAGALYESPNRQMDYDHSYDLSLVMGDRIAARMIEETNQIFRSYGQEINRYAGPVVMDCFGEPVFEPFDKEENLRFTDHQKTVYGKYRNDLQLLVHRYIKEEERSFTIIAWPLPTIGDDFDKIFHETVAINTMSSETYMPVQEKIIAALDQAEYVKVKGRGNDTDMHVVLHKLTEPEKQTNFENCLSDVNIPLGEVFTSPVLTGTTGVLNVKSVFIEGIQFKNLRIEFKNGRVTDYSCDNFSDAEASKALIRRVIFGEKENLPIGEFAIGTNTLAYRMIERYSIGARMPILIAEKTGPHFAVGDTCYSFMEDMKLYNPDGKEIIAKDNECSVLRDEEPDKAYFAVHTDITIPYNELDTIIAVTSEGEEISIIRDGRFVLEGTEVLNAPLDD